MWQWITTNGIWVFISSILVIIMLYVLRALLKTIPHRHPRKKRHKLWNLFFWIIEGLTLAVVIVTLIAIILSKEGVANLVTVESIQGWFLGHGLFILVLLIVGAFLWFAAGKFIPPLVVQALAKPKKGESAQGMKRRADTLVGVFTGLTKTIVAIMVFFMILSELNVEIGPILAGLGIVGVAVGFGAQYLIRDLIAGVFILMENQYRVGDVASVAGVTALVEEINLRKTVLRDLDGVVHHVPNGEIKVASNYSRHFSRVNLDISVSYGTDLDFAIGVINRVGTELAADPKWSEHIITPPQALRVNKFGDSGIDIKILGDCKPLQQWALMGELRLRLKRAFDQENIEIPWPHMKVFFGDDLSGINIRKQD